MSGTAYPKVLAFCTYQFEGLQSQCTHLSTHAGAWHSLLLLGQYQKERLAGTPVPF